MMPHLQPTESISHETGSSFIHSSLDDAGLSPAEFRIYCHISRRGECFSKLESIASTCRISLPTTRKALKLLTALGMLESQRRDGTTTKFRTTPVADWKPYTKLAPLQKEDRAIVELKATPTVLLGATPIADLGATPIKRRPQSTSPEVNPLKAIPLKVLPHPTSRPRDCPTGNEEKIKFVMNQLNELLGCDVMLNLDTRSVWLKRAKDHTEAMGQFVRDLFAERARGRLPLRLVLKKATKMVAERRLDEPQ
jgi:hypothetical protein